MYRKIWSLLQYKAQEKFSFEYSALESSIGREREQLIYIYIYTHMQIKITKHIFDSYSDIFSIPSKSVNTQTDASFPSLSIINNITSLNK